MKIEIESEDLKALLDIATESLDFGSGFLDDEEVDTLRRLASAVGVDPIEVTPTNFVMKHPHVYKSYMEGRDRCYYCNMGSANEIHIPIDV